MSKSARNRKRKPGRRVPFRLPRRRILVVCEGLITEPQYLIGLRNHFRIPLVEIEIFGEGCTPKKLVGKAKERKKAADKLAKDEPDENLRFDAVWCVFDVDEHPFLDETRIMAQDNGIELAISNPCFELWLLLHFQDNPGAHDRTRMLAKLKKHLVDYDKAVDFANFVDGYDKAVERGRRMRTAASARGDHGRNPSTDADLLTELIRKP